MKTCTKCSIQKPETDFAKKNSNADGRDSWCKTCKNAFNRAYYSRTKQVHNPSRRARAEHYRAAAMAWVATYLQSHPCVDCGESDIVVLEFDHIQEKVSSVSKLMFAGYSTERIRQEVERCEVRCANCHRRVTAQRANQWRTKV